MSGFSTCSYCINASSSKDKCIHTAPNARTSHKSQPRAWLGSSQTSRLEALSSAAGAHITAHLNAVHRHCRVEASIDGFLGCYLVSALVLCISQGRRGEVSGESERTLGRCLTAAVLWLSCCLRRASRIDLE